MTLAAVEPAAPLPLRFSLDRKTAVVTGALGLLGREHCRALAEAGARVVVADLSGDSCSLFAKSLRNAYGCDAMGFGVDITDARTVAELRDATRDRFGACDVLVNNAAVDDKFESPALAAEQSRFEHYPLERWRRLLDVNVTGTFLCSQVLGTEMAGRGSGSIINIASTYGVVAPQQSLYRNREGEQQFYKGAAYPTSKGAVLAFTRFLAAYWGPHGVRVNALSPGGVSNRQDEHFQRSYAQRTPLGRMASPEDYRGALVFLASEASSYMTGANLIVDGGWTVW